MGLGYGLISCQRSAGDPRSWTELYAEALDLAVAAEDLGLDSVWTTEHHFVDDGYMPSLLPFSAAVAARTARIRIGTGVILAPLYHPLRLAEDAATTDLISRGRLVLGLGLGWSQTEFDALGADRSQRGRAMGEILGILSQAWTGEPIRHHGSVYDLPEVAVRPVPEQPIPLVVGGGADAAVVRAAHLADGFFSNASPDRFTEQVRVATRAMTDSGRDPAGFSWTYYQHVYPCKDPDQGWQDLRQHLWTLRWKYSDFEASAGRSGPLPPTPPPDTETEAALRASALVGPAAWIAEQISELAERVGVEFDFVARSYFPTMSSAQQHELLEELATDVAPLVG